MPLDHSRACPSTWGDENIPCDYVFGHENDHAGVCYVCGGRITWENDNAPEGDEDADE